MIRIGALVGVLMLLAAPAYAQSGDATATAYFKVGEDLQAACYGTAAGEEKSNTAEYLLCLGYLQGVVDSDTTMTEWGRADRFACIPQGVTSSELRTVLLAWLAERPDHLHFSAASLALTAFAEAWPCAAQ